MRLGLQVNRFAQPGGDAAIGPGFADIAGRAEDAGFASLWVMDHFFQIPVAGSADEPMLAGYAALAFAAGVTRRIKLGTMVTGVTYRHPAVLVKTATTLDVLSGGRAYLGIGAAWFEREHVAFGIEYGSSPGDRLRWLGEALPVIRGMLRGEEPTAAGKRYHAREVRNDPPPVQQRLPLLVGGGGERVTLKLVARYADANNVGGGFESVKRKEAALLRHCETVGRNPAEIERTAGMGTVIIRDSEAEARRVFEAMFERHRARPWDDQPVGTPEQVLERFAPYLDIGYRHFICGFPAPHDAESMERLVREVKPKLVG